MEPVLALIAVGLVAWVLAGPIMALVALRRSAAARRDEALLVELQARTAALESRLNVMQRRAAAAAAKAPDTPEEIAVAPPAAVRPGASAPTTPSPAPPPIPAGRPPQAARPAPPPHAAPPRTPPPLTPPPARIDWERWVGIRGAAVLGAVALGLAGLLFFKYSIEHGLVTPPMRVVLGILTGLACLVGADRLRSRGYGTTAEGVAGAGVVILYAAFWAAHVLYGLIGMTVCFTLMILVTATCCLQALRHASLLVAVLGLLGGFATPLLLASGEDRPIGLFGYVLLLDLGLLLVGQRKGWPSLALLSLLGTVLMQGLWIGARMTPDRAVLGLVILAVFAALFVVFGQFAAGAATERAWLRTRVAAILFPFAFALYFASRVDLGPRLFPLGLLLGALAAGAVFVARGSNQHALGLGAATAAVAVVGVWTMHHAATAGTAWELVAVSLGLAAVFHLGAELDRDRAEADGPASAAMLAAGGFFFLLIAAAVAAPIAPWPWLAGWAGLAALLYRHAGFPGRAPLQLLAATGIGIGLTLLHLTQFTHAGFPRPSGFLALLVGAGLALQGAALLRRDPETRRFAEHAAAALPSLLLIGLAAAPFTRSLPALPALETGLVLGLLVVLAATRLSSGAWYAAAVGLTSLLPMAWIANRAALRDQPREIAVALAIETLAVLILTAWPFLTLRRFASERWAFYAAALAGPLWFRMLRQLFEWRFGDAFIGLLPLLLGAVSLLAVDRARRVWPVSDPTRRSAIVWFSAVALCFVAVAIPLQLEKEWVTIGWALEGLAVLALWRRLDHPGLKYFGLALGAAATVRLVANPALLGYYPRSAHRLVNWLLYTYLAPAAALLWSAAILKPRETERARPWEGGLYAAGHAVGAVGSGLAAIVVLFVWINLTIADWFATGETLTLSFGEQPAQRLTVSIAWVIYALALLGFGMGRDSLGLRWLSLSFLLVAIGKVFLYDLGALRDLYRVASLAGLAVSLLLVSLLYQRFVFRRARGAEGS